MTMVVYFYLALARVKKLFYGHRLLSEHDDSEKVAESPKSGDYDELAEN